MIQSNSVVSIVSTPWFKPVCLLGSKFFRAGLNILESQRAGSLFLISSRRTCLCTSLFGFSTLFQNNIFPLPLLKIKTPILCENTRILGLSRLEIILPCEIPTVLFVWNFHTLSCPIIGFRRLWGRAPIYTLQPRTPGFAATHSRTYKAPRSQQFRFPYSTNSGL